MNLHQDPETSAAKERQIRISRTSNAPCGSQKNAPPTKMPKSESLKPLNILGYEVKRNYNFRWN